ncbi:SMI1/KNR4 family protein [Lignipirellula cremea]|uniref:Knr4/Smi1-like domain-containing protein n=1 Tax=Lignipirellula cremea TaxID=2528010 RepID=A0A518DVD5_9BACT|nr:SMI1/KNR4 family protein [Lignipirellula cremea]QDU95799.1 hypothetical protein Pla8534_36160 [Lignipirellula cremea]
MIDFHDLQYEPDSFAGPFSEERLNGFVSWWNAGNLDYKLRFEDEYIEHMRCFHGGSPTRNVLRLPSGKSYAITLFYNWLASENESRQAEFGAACIWTVESTRLADGDGFYLFPFAELNTGDILCFDLRSREKPSVVVWSRNSRRSHSATELVATSFMAFLKMLENPPARQVDEFKEVDPDVQQAARKMLQGIWNLKSGSFEGLDFPQQFGAGTKIDFKEPHLTIISPTRKKLRFTYEFDPSSEPYELYANEGEISVCGWFVRFLGTELELATMDPGEPGAPTWAGFPSTGQPQATAIFVKQT